ncbi:sialate O-acetylesterase [Gracilimonas mengyeensis]|nr:sialate O-acetylesterase [Gracilimonas mengyeensis]
MLPVTAFAQLSVSKLFQSRVVLQRDKPVKVWGKANVDANVSITFAQQELSTQVAANGEWEITFPAMDAGGPYTMTITSGDQSITVTDVLVGDVYLISGQSNMEWPLSASDGGSAEASSANYPEIREFKISKATSPEISDELGTASWKKATTGFSTGSFSAVGYYFAKHIHAEEGVPIGLVNNSYGGARIEAFMSEQMLGYDEEDVELANGETERQPTLIYNKMVHPILPFAYKGILWYQAESNGDSMTDALAYGELFRTMITSWRDSLNQGDLPFLWVQLPNYGQPAGDTPSTWDAWPQLRAQQSSALSLPNTGEAITIDVGGTDIHPTNKEPVGDRLALLARKMIYGEDIVAQSPRYQSNALTDSGTVVIRFENTGSGLVTIPESEDVHAFALAGENEQFVWANAKIEDNQVIVWHDDIPEPETIRYAWEYNPGDVNLYNTEGLPAAPFQTAVNPGFSIGSFESARSAIEVGQSTTLSWQVFNAASITLDGASVDSVGSQTVTPTQTTTYELIAVSRSDVSLTDTARVTVEVLSPENINRTYGKLATASSHETCCGDPLLPEFAVDEDMSTRWSSAWSDGTGDNPAEPNYDGTPDDEWITVDLENAIDLERVILRWEAAYGSSYDIQVSYDGFLWNTVYEERAGDGGEDNIVFEEPVTGRYLRMQGIDRATEFGYSLFEIAAYGTVSSVQPPEVSISTSFGNFLNKNQTTVTVNATAGSEVSEITTVAFYVNGELAETITEAPYSAEIEVPGADEFTVTAVATDANGIQVQSSPLVLYGNRDNMTLFEAEADDVTTTGGASVGSHVGASGGEFLDLQDAWTVTLPDLLFYNSGEKLVVIGYQLLYETPKSQYLVVNGDTVETIEFTAPDTESWMTYATKINIEDPFGDNQIAIHGFWNWMGIDYIKISDINIGLSTEDGGELPTRFDLKQNYPNPFNPTTQITFQLPKTEKIKLQVFDVTGKLVGTLVDKVEQAGTHTISFDAGNLSSGIYFYQLSGSFGIRTQKMTLIK